MEIETITTSYTRKISHALYGGGQYESSDHFVSLSAVLETGEDPIEAHAQLQATAKELVEKSITEEIEGFQGGSVPPAEFFKFLYDYVAGRLTDPEQFDETRKKLSPAYRNVIEIIRKARATRKRDEKKVEDNDIT